MRGRLPTYRDPALHFDALRLVALRERGRTEGTLATENERGKCLHVHLRTYTQPTQILTASGYHKPRVTISVQRYKTDLKADPHSSGRLFLITSESTPKTPGLSNFLHLGAI